MSSLRRLALAALALTLGAGAAHADRIDGDWCSLEGGHLAIDGPNVVTPGGAKLIGDYGRHSFSYIIPEPEKSAGATLHMILLNETAMRSRVGASLETPTLLWRRCDATS